MIVVDASVAVKWFLSEPGSAAATLLLDRSEGEVIGPNLLGIEVCATLVRGANVEKSNRIKALGCLAKFNSMVESREVSLHQTNPDRLLRAAKLAVEIGHPLKDCIYLVLAMELGCPLATADARFAAKAREVYDAVRMLGAET